MELGVRSAKARPNRPLYEEVAERIREAITASGLVPGDRVESEAELARRFGVSRVTLRRAIDILVRKHVLVKRHGTGTFLASRRLAHSLIGLHSTRDLAQAYGVGVEARVSDHQFRRASTPELQRLQLRAGDMVLSFVRCDYLDGQAISVAECVLPADIAAGLTPERLVDNSTYELLEATRVAEPTVATQTMRAEAARGQVARWLGLRPGNPVFVLERLTFDRVGKPLELGIVTYRSDAVECSIELARDGATTGIGAPNITMRYAASPAG